MKRISKILALLVCICGSALPAAASEGIDSDSALLCFGEVTVEDKGTGSSYSDAVDECYSRLAGQCGSRGTLSEKENHNGVRNKDNSWSVECSAKCTVTLDTCGVVYEDGSIATID